LCQVDGDVGDRADEVDEDDAELSDPSGSDTANVEVWWHLKTKRIRLSILL
jgi:hypothetical protein